MWARRSLLIESVVLSAARDTAAIGVVGRQSLLPTRERENGLRKPCHAFDRRAQRQHPERPRQVRRNAVYSEAQRRAWWRQLWRRPQAVEHVGAVVVASALPVGQPARAHRNRDARAAKLPVARGEAASVAADDLALVEASFTSSISSVGKALLPYLHRVVATAGGPQ